LTRILTRVLLTLAAVAFGVYVLQGPGEGGPGAGEPLGAAAGTVAGAVPAGAAPGSDAPPGMMTVDTRPSQRQR